jgi:phage tail P2-like protein
MANKVVMADSISYLPEFNAWYNVIKETLAEIDLGLLLVYIIDNVDASALPYLAEQFDVLGYKGLKLATTEAAKRQVIKRAIELHRFKGTKWAIQEALKSIGFANIEVLETGYDHWAKFGLLITTSSVQLTDASFYDIIQMVKEYKRAVCVLEEVLMKLEIEDTLDLTEDEAFITSSLLVDDILHLSGGLQYDATGQYDGDYDHSGDSDIVTFV